MASGHHTAAGALFNELQEVVEPHVVLQEVAVAPGLCQPPGKALPGESLEESLAKCLLHRVKEGLRPATIRACPRGHVTFRGKGGR